MLFLLFCMFVTSLLSTEVSVSNLPFMPDVPKEHYKAVDFWADVYSKKYNIPRGIIDGVLYRETLWEDDFEDYNAFVIGDRGSKSQSYGPGQVKIRTAKSIWRGNDIDVTKDKLLYDVAFNVETSCKLLRILYDDMSKYYKKDKDRWLAALTTYNMGHNGFLIKNKKQPNSYAYFVYGYYKKG